MIDYRVPIEIGAVRIKPGYLVFGDTEGVLIIPKAEEEAVSRALEKASTESAFATAIRNGMPAAGLRRVRRSLTPVSRG